MARVQSDYRIVEDPPAADYTELAKVKAKSTGKTKSKSLAGAASALADSAPGPPR
jgi:hypothetical protein